MSWESPLGFVPTWFATEFSTVEGGVFIRKRDILRKVFCHSTADAAWDPRGLQSLLVHWLEYTLHLGLICDFKFLSLFILPSLLIVFIYYLSLLSICLLESCLSVRTHFGYVG